mmetsp:Transcript_19368/g.36223  ORF Transcript_19368/g.36223 Transcript_19368/m.36223 type:complete len:867 (-) Transcript_19368:81-2681(-)
MAGSWQRHFKVLAVLLLAVAPAVRAVNRVAHSAREPVALEDSKVGQTAFPSALDGLMRNTIGVALLIVFSVIVAVAAFSFLSGGSKPKEPRPAAEVNAEVSELTKQREDIKEQVAKLEQRIENLRLEAEEEARKAKIAEEEAAAAAALAYEQEHAGEKSQEEVMVEKEAVVQEEAMMQTLAKLEEEAEKDIEKVKEFGAKAAAKADEIKTVVVTGAEQAFLSLEKFAKETVETVTGEVQEVLNTSISEGEILEWTENAEEVGGVSFTMPLPLLLAGIFAPVQLQIIKAWNSVLMMLQLPLLLMFLFAMSWDHDKKCHDGFLWYWAIAISVMLGLNVLLRYIAVKGAEAGIQETHSVIEEHGVHRSLAGGTMLQRWEHVIHRFWTHVTSSAKDYFKVLLVYDGITQSGMYTLISFLNFAVIVWGGVGVYMVIQYAVQEETQCAAQVLRFTVRLYCFVYIVLLIYSIIGLVIWLVEALIMSQAVSLAILQKAWDFDSHYSPSGVPILSLLVRALLLRNKSDMAALELNILNSEIDELREQREELAAQEAELDGALSEAQIRLEVVSKSSHLHASADELAEIYAEELTGMMDKVAVFGVMAENLYEKYGPAAIERARARSMELLAEAEEEALMLSEAAKAQARDTMSAAEAKAKELSKDPRLSQGLQKLQEQGSALAGVSLKDLQAQAEEAAKLAEAKAQELAKAGKKKAHEAGLDHIDVGKLQKQAKDAAEQVVLAAVHKAEEAGLDINALLHEAEEQAQKLALSAQDVAQSAAAQAQSAAAQAQSAAESAGKQLQELSQSEQAQELRKKAGELGSAAGEQLGQAASAGKEAVQAAASAGQEAVEVVKERKSSWFSRSQAKSSSSSSS